MEAKTVRSLPAKQETQVQSLGWEDSLEKGMTTHSSILALGELILRKTPTLLKSGKNE